MVRGLYTGASGALVAQSMADNVANNLANVNTGGFKNTLLQIQSASTLDIYRIQTDPGQASGRATPGVPTAQYVGVLGTGSQIYDTPTDFSEGPLEATGNKLDLALSGNNGNAFFMIQTPQGVRYTRDGAFLKDANNNLVTRDGNNVLGQNGLPIVLDPQGEVTIGRDGAITQNNRSVGTIGLAQFGNLNSVRPQGDNLFAAMPNAGPGPITQGVAVQQGYLEKSNANVVRSMVDLINAERWFDANERVIKNQDDATGLAITQLAKTQAA